MLYHSIDAPTQGYIDTFSLQSKRVFDVHAFERLGGMVERHQIFRTSFIGMSSKSLSKSSTAT